MTDGCAVCHEKGTWAGEKRGSHKICLSCHRKGYHFRQVKKGEVEVISPRGKVIGHKRIRD